MPRCGGQQEDSGTKEQVVQLDLVLFFAREVRKAPERICRANRPGTTAALRGRAGESERCSRSYWGPRNDSDDAFKDSKPGEDSSFPSKVAPESVVGCVKRERDDKDKEADRQCITGGPHVFRVLVA